MGTRTDQPACDDVTGAEFLELRDAPETPEEKAFLDKLCSDPEELLKRARARLAAMPEALPPGLLQADAGRGSLCGGVNVDSSWKSFGSASLAASTSWLCQRASATESMGTPKN